MSLRDQVLSDFIDAWNGGRRPRAADHLRRVEPGPERDALAAELTLWLEIAAPPRSVDRDAVRSALTAGWPEALPRLRARAGYDLPALAGRLVDDLGLDDGAERAAAYLGEMEGGTRGPDKVSRRLLDVLGRLLGVTADALADLGGPPPRATPLFRDEDGGGADLAAQLRALARAASTRPPRDELERLFDGGPDA